MSERTLVLVKPDGVSRGLIGKILTTFEDAGLKIVEMKMVTASKEILTNHYPITQEWLANVGNNTLGDFKALGIDPVKELGSADPVAVGKVIKQWLVDWMASAPVVAMILEGNEAVKNVRRLAGKTLPFLADPGSIRGRYSCDSPTLASREKRPVFNLVHASGAVDEAEFEIGLWFPEAK